MSKSGACEGCGLYFVRLDVHYGRKVDCKRKMIQNSLLPTGESTLFQFDQPENGELPTDPSDSEGDQDAQMYEPFVSKAMLEMAYWHVTENSTGKARDRMAKIGMHDQHGNVVMQSTKFMNDLIDTIPRHHPELDSGIWITSNFGKLSYI